MNAKAQTLFHFTKNIDVLKAILKEGFCPRYSVEDFRWQATGPQGHEYAAFPMVCFCDIPLSRIEDHVSDYGRYGLGLSRAWGERAGLNPLLYINGSKTSLSRALLNLAEVSRRQDAENAAIASYFIQHVAGFTKPVTGRRTWGEEEVDKDFYQESEWRFVPYHDDLPQFLPREQYIDASRLIEANQKAREVGMLSFSPSDVRYIFVEFDSQIPDIINFISSLKMDADADRKLLMSRVTSLETIRSDW